MMLETRSCLVLAGSPWQFVVGDHCPTLWQHSCGRDSAPPARVAFQEWVEQFLHGHHSAERQILQGAVLEFLHWLL